jgi:hypothetical protein
LDADDGQEDKFRCEWFFADMDDEDEDLHDLEERDEFEHKDEDDE